MYDITNENLVRTAEGAQPYEVIRVERDELHFEARTARGRLCDAFTLKKRGAGLSNELTRSCPNSTAVEDQARRANVHRPAHGREGSMGKWSDMRGAGGGSKASYHQGPSWLSGYFFNPGMLIKSPDTTSHDGIPQWFLHSVCRAAIASTRSGCIAARFSCSSRSTDRS